MLLIREEPLQMDVACDNITEGVNVRKLYCCGHYDKCNCAARSCDKAHSCPGCSMTEALLTNSVLYGATPHFDTSLDLRKTHTSTLSMCRREPRRIE